LQPFNVDCGQFKNCSSCLNINTTDDLVHLKNLLESQICGWCASNGTCINLTSSFSAYDVFGDLRKELTEKSYSFRDMQYNSHHENEQYLCDILYIDSCEGIILISLFVLLSVNLPAVSYHRG